MKEIPYKSVGASNLLVERRVEGRRLAYYMATGDARFWDRHWQSHFSATAFEKAKEGVLGQFEKLFTRYLPTTGTILEAGCGLGQYVMALRARGYDCEGVDWANETINAVRNLWPTLPITVGDVLQLNVPDGYYQGYISLGVVEHRQNGPEPFLLEANRVLSKGGMMLVSVPYFHALRRLKAHLGLYSGQVDGLSFYQYAYTPEEMNSILERIGFITVDTFVYDGLKGVRDEVPILKRILRWRGIGWRLEHLLRSSQLVQRKFGHMILFACRKVNS